MASFFSRSKRHSEQKRKSGTSLRASPNVSVRTVQESESNISHHQLNSTLFSAYEECSRNESFDLLPKTDYTYARSGSYSPRHLRKSYVNPNMSRRRLRGVVTPPVSMLEDSDSDIDITDQINYQQNERVQMHTDVADSASHIQSSASRGVSYYASYAGHYETDQLDFDSDDADLDGEEAVLAGNVRIKDKQSADEENLRIQQSQHLDDTEYRHYYSGMVLRSGSHLTGVKRFLDSHEPSHRKSSSVANHTSANISSNALDFQGTPLTHVFDKRQTRNDHPAYDAGQSTTTTTTTVTKTVTEIEEEELNKNNNARARLRSRSPARLKSGRGGIHQSIDLELETEKKLLRDENQREKSHRIDHMYGLDYTDDFSDSDSYTSSSYTSSGDYMMAGGGKHHGFVARSVFFVLTVVTTIVDTLYGWVHPVTKPLWKYIVKPVYKSGAACTMWIWERVTRIGRVFILLDAWLLSRNARRGCCLCLPLLLLLPLLFSGGYYIRDILPAKSSFFAFPASFFTQHHTTHIHQGDTVQSINLLHEVKQIVQQLQSGNRDWLTKAEIESLVKGMLHPEMESLRVSLLNIANEGNSDQAALKVDQNDAKLRLAALEEQIAALLARAKIFEQELSDSKSQFAGTLAGDRDKQAEGFAALEAALSDLRVQLGSLQTAYSGLVAHSKTCCINDTDLVVAIRNNVNDIIAEMFGNDGKGEGKGGSAFAGWLNQNYVDRKEFERQLRLLTADITDRISAGLEAHRFGHNSPLVVPSGAGTLSEDAVKLIVEDALLKYSADRTGLPDYALESAGGSVLSVRCSETYYRKTALISVFGIPLWYTSNSPRTVIQPEVHPGQCWAFKGQSGYIVIQLAVPIRPTGFSLEHIPKSLSMTGNIDSAPKDFAVFGLRSEMDTKGVNLGNFTYQVVGKPIQHFDVQIGSPGTFEFVELRVLNNHGNKEYTCLYRFRVHGVPQP